MEHVWFLLKEPARLIIDTIKMLKNDTILLSHGSGGKLSRELIQNLFFRYFENELLLEAGDSAIIQGSNKLTAFTTDSYVVDPLFFPGGDIGKLAVCGTVNDLSVSGAVPVYLSAGFIIEEGLELKILEKIVKRMAETAVSCGVKIVTGDTKIVDCGKCDKLFINTAGIGYLNKKCEGISSGEEIAVGDKIIVNGTIGDHGVAVMSARNDLNTQANIESDCAPLNGLIAEVLEVEGAVRFMRDATRGGVATVLNEICEYREFGIQLDEDAIPVKESVRGMCEFFGFDPLYIANEGKVIMVVDSLKSDEILSVIKNHPLGKEAAIIGEITEKNRGKVLLKTKIGGKRIIDMLTGEQLPRIC